jgi:hypothetical protein
MGYTEEFAITGGIDCIRPANFVRIGFAMQRLIAMNQGRLQGIAALCNKAPQAPRRIGLNDTKSSLYSPTLLRCVQVEHGIEVGLFNI